MTHLPGVEFLQGDTELVNHRLGLVALPGRAAHAPHAASEHHVEHVEGGTEAPAPAPASTLLDGVLTTLVINLSFLRV